MGGLPAMGFANSHGQGVKLVVETALAFCWIAGEG
jgi:hypothetical protein